MEAVLKNIVSYILFYNREVPYLWTLPKCRQWNGFQEKFELCFVFDSIKKLHTNMKDYTKIKIYSAKNFILECCKRKIDFKVSGDYFLDLTS